MPLGILNLLAFDGPNRYGPQPGVVMRLALDRDQTAPLRTALKETAQRVGIVLAYLEVSAAPRDGAVQCEVRFSTPTPALGAAVAQLAADRLQAEESGSDWEAALEERFWELQQRRRTEALPLEALQLTADAAAHGVMAFVRPDGLLQLGTGSRSRAVPIRWQRGDDLISPETVGVGRAAPPGDVPAPGIDWATVGQVPLVAWSGGAARDIAARLFAARTSQASWQVHTGLAFDQARAALSDSTADGLILALDQASLATRGLPFDACDACAIVGMPEGSDRAEQALVAGLPLLVTRPTGVAALDADVPEIAALISYAPCPVVLFAQAEATVSGHSGTGGAVVYCTDGMIYARAGDGEQQLGMAEPGVDIKAQLATAALWWGLLGTNPYAAGWVETGGTGRHDEH
jgi:hypothetical protein